MGEDTNNTAQLDLTLSKSNSAARPRIRLDKIVTVLRVVFDLCSGKAH